MNAPLRPLADHEARRVAMAIHDRSFLVEAGAGSGKTAIMAGRIALMLAAGIAPRRIAAVTFTEFAASELLIRVHGFVAELAAGRIPAELRVALPNGLSEDKRHHLSAAVATIDEMTCSTIHGFCQRLIKPYPVEADIDPGAAVMDREQADLAFAEIADAWLREALEGNAGGLLAEMVMQDPEEETLELIPRILGHIRSRRTVSVEAPEALAPLIKGFRDGVRRFAAFVHGADADEPETTDLATLFAEMAEALATSRPAERLADLVRLLVARPHPDLCTAAGSFRAYKKKGKWVSAARLAGLAKADAERLNATASDHYAACCGAWAALKEAIAGRVLADLAGLLQPVLDRFQVYKRGAALLDFDDLIFAARTLLRDHEDVRRALADRFAHVLVDEFQDTDPLQTEIFWRLCGEPPVGAADAGWTSFQIRPGALFLVADPKQAIYRFRGADVAAYTRAREAFAAQAPDSVLSISTNFRSSEPILRYVNDRFGQVLSAGSGQPGFTALAPFHSDRNDGLGVAALDIAVADIEGKASTERQRDAEADAVAEMCARLIGSEAILDRATGERRACRAGDIALLAPTGNDLWRYEEALERRGIPVATQAGKGLFRRQEIQDLIALTRALADRRDTLALGALLRGPLVGLTEEELLDIVWALPRSEDAPDALQRLDLTVTPETIAHSRTREVIEKLQALRGRLSATTPYDLLSQAVDVLRVRPILLQRHGGQAERALANVDLYLSFSLGYAIRGLRAFAESMTAAWSDGSRAVEGRPDAQEEAVVLYTMHAAKGLEWPIVVPVNTMCQIRAPDGAFTDRGGRFYCPVLGVTPTGYGAAREAEKAELERERIRLWYVAATRARDLLVLPRLDVDAKGSAWVSLLDLSITELPALDLRNLPPVNTSRPARAQNKQTREVFAAEAATIAERRRHIVWLAPSRDETAAGPALQPGDSEILATDIDVWQPGENVPPSVQGGRERGVVLHKLIEEILTGETAETEQALAARAEVLIRAIGCPVANDPREGLVPGEVAACVRRTLSLPEIVALRPGLLPEYPVYASVAAEDREDATAGIVDAIALGPDGAPHVVIDWKSDVDPSPEAIKHYRKQVDSYLSVTGAARGLIVLATSGMVIAVERRSEPAS